MSIQIGDRVQIKHGAIDVTNGRTAVAGKSYGQGGPLWCTVEAIIDGWNTGSRYGLPSSVTKVRCSNNGVVVWQVQPQDIAGQITASPTQQEPSYPSKAPSTTPTIDIDWGGNNSKFRSSGDVTSLNMYAPRGRTWQSDQGTTVKRDTSLPSLPSTLGVSTQIVSGRNAFEINEEITTNPRGTFRDLTSSEQKVIGSNSVQVDEGVLTGAKIKTAFQNPEKKRQLLNEDSENIMNQYSFPYKSSDSQGLISAKYDYQIIPGDSRYSKVVNLEDKLMKARAAFGIPVHGNNNIARSMKYFMYNRFKVPDTNLAHNKTFTYVFFTRPDVNLLTPGSLKANDQALNHSEVAMIWKRYPELFKLLTDNSRCADSNNFNMLLSNQVRSFDIQDEEITTNRAAKSWHEYEMQYGDVYTGRSAGTFRCNFDETSDYSVINFIKLWITYIDMVSKGAWSPSYNLRGGDISNRNINYSHIFTKTLDYAASAYVFKCGPDGEDVLYWTKYFGVFPINTGAQALSWDHGTMPGEGTKLNIGFAYSAKRDMNPISLIEFNQNAGVPLPAANNSVTYEDAFNPNYGHTDRPFVGAPFIAMDLGSTEMLSDRVNTARKRTEIRLKFQKANSKLSDDILFKSH